MTLEERIETLERELASAKHRNRWALAVGAAAIVGLAWAGAWITAVPSAQAQGAGAASNVVRANAFIVEDEDGKPRAMIAATKDGPGLGMYDENGKTRAGILVTKHGPALDMYDENGKPRAAIGVTKDGPRLRMFDENGKPRAAIGVTKNGPVLGMFNENGKVIWGAP